MALPLSPPSAWRIVVAGSGIPALAFALATKQALEGTVEVAILDPALGRRRPDSRAFAVSPAVRCMLATLGVWEPLATRAQAIRDMVITDSGLADVVRPDYLSFAEARPGEPLAYMVEGDDLAAGLAKACEAAGIALDEGTVRSAQAGSGAAAVTTSDGNTLTAALVVACDGARSRLRAEAGIGWVGWDYPQAGLVATIGHARDHCGRAVQHFLPSGPFAILPLVPDEGGHRSSIVWTERRSEVGRILALPPEALLAEIEARFGRQLGRLRLETPVASFPLAAGLARRFVGERLALLGDAAHQIHPLAGQGLNLGLADAAALAEAVADAVRLGLDPGGPDGLAGYERARRPPALAMAAATDGLNRLFSNDSLPLRLVRDLGLGLVDRMAPLKRRLAAAASGAERGAPRLLRGKMP
jgi:2-octaprenyl-6-methoxyphenol hydroxylase